jgi:hypothetical protein
MEIHSLKGVSDDILSSFDKMLNRDCQAGKYSLTEIRKVATNTDILYLFDKDTPVYFLLLDVFHKHKTVYIHDVCVNKLHRGKSLFKKSLSLLKEYYTTRGYTNFTLDASYSIEEGLDQKARIHIFHSAGFHINTETGYFTEAGDYNIINTLILLDNKEIVEIQRKEGDDYYVKNKKGKVYSIKINQIEKCLNSELNQIPCPMIMYIKGRGGKRKTLKRG